MTSILCAVCELPISPEESFAQALEVRHQHLYPDQCIRLLRAENAALREDKARLVEALERICTHSRDAQGGGNGRRRGWSSRRGDGFGDAGQACGASCGDENQLSAVTAGDNH